MTRTPPLSSRTALGIQLELKNYLKPNRLPALTSGVAVFRDVARSNDALYVGVSRADGQPPGITLSLPYGRGHRRWDCGELGV